MADKQTREQLLQEYSEKLEQGIQDIFTSGRFAEYLKTISHFHHYSMRNTALIFMQNPNATRVAGFNKWRDEFERFPQKGEKSIKIFAPAPITVQKEMDKLDEDGKPVLDEQGQPVKEMRNIKIPQYKVVSVFDVGQTYGKPLPQLSETLEGNVQHYDLLIQALEDTSPYPVIYEQMDEDTDGFFDRETIDFHIREGMSQPQTVLANVHERSHGELHRTAPENETPEQRQARRNREEVEAESISYTVCQYFGIETGANSFGYIASWSKDKELSELQASLETIKKTASRMIDSIEARFNELKKEHGIEQDVIEAETVRVVPTEQFALAFAADYYNYMAIQNFTRDLPRFGMDEPEIVVADIAKGIVDGSGIADIRDSIQSRLVKFDELGIDDEDAAVTAADEMNADGETLLRRLHGLGKVEYIVPAQTATESNYNYVEKLKSYIDIQWENDHISDADREILIDNVKTMDAKMLDIIGSYDPDIPYGFESDTIDSIIDETLAQAQEQTIPASEKQYELNYAPMGNGLTVWNRLEEKDGDYVTVAHIAPDRAVTYYDLNMPEAVRAQIEDIARTSNATISATQDAPVFSTPPTLNIELPDPTITAAEMNDYGYLYDGMLPLQTDRALELFNQGHTVYMLRTNDAEAMVMELAEIEEHDGIFGIEKEEWAAIRELEATQKENPSVGRLEYLDEKGNVAESVGYTNEQAFIKKVREEDYHGAAFNIVVYRDGTGNRVNTDSFVNDINPTRTLQFITAPRPNESHIKTAEMSTEQNYNMIDGIPNNTTADKVEIHSACNSNYKGMIAFVAADDNVYLGKEENYHNISSFVLPWHKPNQEYGDAASYYDNSDNSLVFITDNKDIYSFLYDTGWVLSQEQMMKEGYFTPETYGEWAALSAGVLAQFEQTREILFNGQPFQPPNHAPTMTELEADVAAGKSVSLMDVVNAQKNEKKTDAPGKKTSLLGRLEQGKKEVAQKAETTQKDTQTRKPGNLEVD